MNITTSTSEEVKAQSVEKEEGEWSSRDGDTNGSHRHEGGV